MQPLSPRQKTLGLAGFFCLLLFILTYFIYHKPLAPEGMLSLGKAGARLGAAGLLMAAGGGLGGWIWRQAVRRLPVLANWEGGGLPAVQAALGLYALALLWLAVGLVGGYRAWAAWGLLAALLVWRRSDALRWGRMVGRMLPPIEGRFEGLIRFCLIWMAGLTLATALAPPLKFDALVYHLALPVEYLQAGRFMFVPHNIYWGWPQTGEMLYTWAISLMGVQTAAVLGWMMAALALVSVLDVVNRAMGRFAAWGAAAALMAGASLAGAWSWAYVDWLAILFGLACLAAWNSLAGDARQPSSAALMLVGGLAGMAIGVKYTAGVVLICALGVVAWHMGRHPLAGLRAAVWMGAAAALAASPWLIKNVVATGNPVYPLLFPAGSMTALRLATYQYHATKNLLINSLLLPWRVVYLGLESAPTYSADIGALLFGLLPGAWLARQRQAGRARWLTEDALVMALTGVAAWMVLGQVFSYLLQARLYFAMFPMLAVAAGAGLWGLQGWTIAQVRIGRLANALVGLVLLFNAVYLSADVAQKAPMPVLLGLQSEGAYYANQLGWAAPALQAVKALPPGSQALLLFEARYMLCRPGCVPDEILDRWLVARRLADGDDAAPEAILQQWRATGLTHLLVHLDGVQFLKDDPYLPYTPTDWQALDSLLNSLPVQQDFGGAYRLYRLAP